MFTKCFFNEWMEEWREKRTNTYMYLLYLHVIIGLNIKSFIPYIRL
jgi:hypothetical protein